MPIAPVPPDQLRWTVPPDALPFATTAQIEPLTAFIGQDSALAALRRGVEMTGPGFNVFVVGALSSGRLATLQRILSGIGPQRRRAVDFVYVRNFADPARPSLLRLPAGRGPRFRKELARLAGVLVEEMPRILNADPIRRAREAQTHALEIAQATAIRRIETHARELGFLIGADGEGEDVEPVPMWMDPATREAETPVGYGRAALQLRLEAGEIKTDIPLEELWRRFDTLESELSAAIDTSRQAVLDTARSLNDVEQEAVRGGTRGFFTEFARRWPAARTWLGSLQDELVESPEWFDEEEPDHESLLAAFTANCVHTAARGRKAPIVVVSNPTWGQLFGGIEGEPGSVDHRSIRGGALLDADGGYLVINAVDMLQEPGVWKVIKRILMYGEMDIQNPEGPMSGPMVLRPDPLGLDVKFVFIGDLGTYAGLYYGDPDVRHLFKIKAEFEDDAELTPQVMYDYARFCARLCTREGLAPLERDAVAAVIEHAVRLTGRGGRITTQLGQLSDLVREAAHEGRADPTVTRAHVERAQVARRQRDNLAERKTLELLQRQVIRVETSGERVGVTNALVVYHVGGHDFGRPLRVTATVGVGRGGVVSIEREVGLSGRSHDKGVQILTGILRARLGRTRTLALTASITFEQSYGRIDGDSASVAELCALLSAITRLPLAQGVAVTGSVNQLGEVQGVGSVTEKIEGFYTACTMRPPDGRQGVIIPRANAPDLHLAPEIARACAEGRFHVWAVDEVEAALEILTGRAAGLPDSEGRYPEDSVFGVAAAALDRFQDIARLQGKKG